MVLVTLILCTDLDDPCALLNESAMVIEDPNAMTDARTNMPLVSAADSDYTPYSDHLRLDNLASRFMMSFGPLNVEVAT